MIEIKNNQQEYKLFSYIVYQSHYLVALSTKYIVSLHTLIMHFFEQMC